MKSWPLESLPYSPGSFNVPIKSNPACEDCGHPATLWVEEKLVSAAPPPGQMWGLSSGYVRNYYKLCEPCYTLRLLAND